MVLKVAVPSNLIGGDVDEGYGKVADAFRANFTAGEKSVQPSPCTATASRWWTSGVATATV